MTVTFDEDIESSKTLKSDIKLPDPGGVKTVPEFLLLKAQRFAEEGRDNFVHNSETNECHSYVNFENETRSIGSAFYKKGLRKGDVVIYMTYNMSSLYCFFVGVWRANGVVRALYPEEDEETVFAATEECRVGWIYCEPEQAKMCLSVAERIYWDVEVIITHGDVEGCTGIKEFYEDDGLELPTLNLESTDPAMMLCTSGTTGTSKSAIHSHATLLETLISCSLMTWSHDPDRPNLILSKATHITGSIFPLTILSLGGTSIVMDRIQIDKSLKAINDFHPRVIWGFPTLLIQIATDSNTFEYDLSSLEIALTAGAPCTPPMIKMIKKLPNLKEVFVLYGLTETVPLTGTMIFNGDKNFNFREIEEEIPDLSVGKVAPGVLLQIRDPESGEILGSGERGEICAKTKTNFIEYFGNPKATREAFVDEFFRTGDIGFFDNNGFVMIVDRLKEIFKYKGNHISPTEIEDVIARHPAVSTVCVVGVPDIEEERGQVPRAFLTKKPGFDTCANEILRFANGQLAEYKHLRGGVYIVDSLPQGKTGKVTRNLVQLLPVPDEE